MFGFRKAAPPPRPPIDWPAVRELLDDSGDRAALQRSFPLPSRESYLAALTRIDRAAASDLIAAGNRLHTAAELGKCPVVAIAGMLNSGKTSLVSTFLSPQGRQRTLRGVGNSQGTHRFVLWLPERWNADVELWQLLLARLGEALGAAPELLASDPEEAHRQYNNAVGETGLITVPLVATDPALNETGIGLLDCPDIVSDESLGLGSPTQRRELLGRAATLCSAFLVVASAEQSRDTTLSELLRIAGELMPGIPRMLAVNKVRPREQQPHEVAETFRPLMTHNRVESLYVAYDFDVPGSQPFIPRRLQRSLTGRAGVEDDLPIFFTVADQPADNPPAEIPADRLLASLPQRLDRGQLFDRFRTALETNLQTAVWQDGRQRIQDDLAADQRRAETARRCLTEVALEVFASRGERGEIERLRLHQTRRIIEQLSAAFAFTAPWYARWTVGLNARYRRVVGGAGDWFRRWLPTQALDEKTEAIRSQFGRGEFGSLMTVEKLVTLIRQHAEAHPIEHWTDSQQWAEACRAALHRYDRDDFTSLDPAELERACQEMWSKVSWLDKGKITTVPLLVMVSSFTAVLLVPIDMGTSFIAAASVSELLAAGGLTAAASVWAGGRTASLVEQQAAKQQLVDFIAVLCDAFGVAREADLPRIRIANQETRLPAAKIGVREPVGPTLIDCQWRPDFEVELKRLLAIDAVQ